MLHGKINLRRIALLLLPLTICSPFIIGAMESYLNVQLLPGRCRIDNTRAVLSQGDRSSRIMSGVVQYKGRAYNHVWGLRSNGTLVDVTCTVPVGRHANVVIDPWKSNMPVVTDNTTTMSEKLKELWDRGYLIAFVAVSGGGARKC